MSIALMAAAWKSTLPMTEKMVLLCLADFANDEGVCWPAVGTIAAKCSCSDRTVQKAIKWLTENDWIKTVDAQGKCHRFLLNPRKICTPENPAPPKITAQTPENPAPKPSMNHHSMEIENAPADFPQDAWVGFARMRKAMKRPLTDRAVSSLLAKLDKLQAKGHDPGEVLDQSTMHNWIGIFEIKEERDGKPIRTTGSADHRSARQRAIDEALASL